MTNSAQDDLRNRKKIGWRRIGLLLGALLVVAQFVPVRRTNPATDAGKTLWETNGAPAEIQNVFQRSCKDCHSNRTAWPWYSDVAPVSWVVANDVNGGRRHFNADEWGSYTTEKKESRLTKICGEVKSGDMPDSKYTLIHRRAKLMDEERNALCTWAESSRQTLLRTEPAAQP